MINKFSCFATFLAVYMVSGVESWASFPSNYANGNDFSASSLSRGYPSGAHPEGSRNFMASSFSLSEETTSSTSLRAVKQEASFTPTIPPSEGAYSNPYLSLGPAQQEAYRNFKEAIQQLANYHRQYSLDINPTPLNILEAAANEWMELCLNPLLFKRDKSYGVLEQAKADKPYQFNLAQNVMIYVNGALVQENKGYAQATFFYSSTSFYPVYVLGGTAEEVTNIWKKCNRLSLIFRVRHFTNDSTKIRFFSSRDGEAYSAMVAANQENEPYRVISQLYQKNFLSKQEQVTEVLGHDRGGTALELGNILSHHWGNSSSRMWNKLWEKLLIRESDLQGKLDFWKKRQPSICGDVEKIRNNIEALSVDLAGVMEAKRSLIARQQFWQNLLDLNDKAYHLFEVLEEERSKVRAKERPHLAAVL